MNTKAAAAIGDITPHTGMPATYVIGSDQYGGQADCGQPNQAPLGCFRRS